MSITQIESTAAILARVDLSRFAGKAKHWPSGWPWALTRPLARRATADLSVGGDYLQSPHYRDSADDAIGRAFSSSMV
jgi:hypothetical protein